MARRSRGAAGSSSGDDVDWTSLTANLPVGRDTASGLRRTELFNRFDVNKNGLLKLAEVDRAIRDAVGLDNSIPLKSMLRRATRVAREANSSKRSTKPRNDEFVERDDFRVLLMYVRQYFEMYVACDRLEPGATAGPSDRRVDLAEFRSSMETLAQWGVHVPADAVEEEFRALDTKRAGTVLFDEFCHWAIRRNPDIEDGHEDAAGKQNVPRTRAAAKQAATQNGAVPLVMPVNRNTLEQRLSEVKLSHEQLVSASASREDAARKRLAFLRARAQRELTREAIISKTEQHRERRRKVVAQVRAETDQLIGRDVTVRVRDVPKLNDEEVHDLSRLFNKQLNSENTNDKRVRNFFKIFKELDLDGSKRISFSELENLVRGRLRVSEKRVPLDQLLGLWKVIDEDASGFIDAGELSRFLRIGAPKTLTAVEAARLRMQANKESMVARVRADTEKLQEKEAATKAAEGPKATSEEVSRFGGLCMQHLATLRSRGQETITWFGLFKRMDTDDSGQVKFEEFETMVREGLCLDVKELPLEMLWALWRVIDGDNNGFISVGEFGRFMRSAVDLSQTKAHRQKRLNKESKEKTREDQAFAELKRAETYARQKASSADAKAMNMEAEAARLEALLEVVHLPEPPSKSSSMMVSRSSASLARARGRADIAESSSDENIGFTPTRTQEASPTERMEALQLLSRDLKGSGAGGRRGRTRSASMPMLLPSLKREEGQI